MATVSREPDPGGQTRVLVIDDHPIVREGLVQIICREPDLMVCAQASNAAEALRALQSSCPDVVILDLTLNGSSGLGLLKDIRARWANLPVLVLSMHNEMLYAERVLRAGAQGYIMKQERPEELVIAIRRVLAGRVYLSEAMANRLLQHITGGHSSDGRSPLDRLTDREFEVFEMIGQGLGTRAIAERLHLSVKTVESHREHTKAKLGLESGHELTLCAIRWAHDESMNAPRRERWGAES